MSRGRVIYIVVVLLLGAAALVAVTMLEGDSPERTARRLTSVGQKLRSVGSARVAFTAQIRPQLGGAAAAWQGTSMIKFGDTEDWDTTYTSIVAEGKAAIQGHGVRVAGTTYFTSPALTTADGRPWFTATTAAFWGAALADPALGLSDFTVWERFLTDADQRNAFSGSTDDLPDVDDADHEYRVRCTPEVDTGCPPPFGSGLDDVFNRVPTYPVFSAWLDDDGLLRKLQVHMSLMYTPEGTPTEAAEIHPQGEYVADMTFELDRFGTPVTVTIPPADQLTRSSVVGPQAGS